MDYSEALPKPIQEEQEVDCSEARLLRIQERAVDYSEARLLRIQERAVGYSEARLLQQQQQEQQGQAVGYSAGLVAFKSQGPAALVFSGRVGVVGCSGVARSKVIVLEDSRKAGTQAGLPCLEVRRLDGVGVVLGSCAIGGFCVGCSGSRPQWCGVVWCGAVRLGCLKAFGRWCHVDFRWRMTTRIDSTCFVPRVEHFWRLCNECGWVWAGRRGRRFD